MPIQKILPAAGAAVVLAAAVAGCNNSTSAKPIPPGGPKAKKAGGTIEATVDEWSVKAPSSTTAGTVTFDVHNTGKVKHEFVVLRTDKPAGALGAGARISESGNVGEAGDLAPGESKTASIKLAPGHYVLVCNLPGHYKAGMHADFTVR